MQIDPKYTFWFGVWTNVLLAVAGIGVDHAPTLIAQYAPEVQWVCGALYKINSYIMTALTAISSNKSGPFVSAPAIPPAIVKVLIAAFALSFLLAASPAAAQTRLKPLTGDLKKDFAPDAASAAPASTSDPKCLLIWDPLKLCGLLTGKPEEDMQRVVKRIQGIGRDDMTYAILKATAANTNASKVRLQCLNAIMDAKNAAEGISIKDANGNVVPRPDPAFVTFIEDTAELVDGLAPGGPLMTGCAGAAQLFKTNTLAAINGIVTGAAALVAVGG